jgi:hypothetical protein
MIWILPSRDSLHRFIEATEAINAEVVCSCYSVPAWAIDAESATPLRGARRSTAQFSDDGVQLYGGPTFAAQVALENLHRSAGCKA